MFANVSVVFRILCLWMTFSVKMLFKSIDVFVCVPSTHKPDCMLLLSESTIGRNQIRTRLIQPGHIVSFSLSPLLFGEPNVCVYSFIFWMISLCTNAVWAISLSFLQICTLRFLCQTLDVDELIESNAFVLLIMSSCWWCLCVNWHPMESERCGIRAKETTRMSV